MTLILGTHPPDTIVVWWCRSCGHWTANSYFHSSNPGWRPRCKTKNDCLNPEMESVPYQLMPWTQGAEPASPAMEDRGQETET